MTGRSLCPSRPCRRYSTRPDELTTIGIKLKKGVDSTRLEEKLYKLPDVQVVSLAQVKDTIMKLISTAKVMVLSIAIARGRCWRKPRTCAFQNIHNDCSCCISIDLPRINYTSCWDFCVWISIASTSRNNNCRTLS